MNSTYATAVAVVDHLAHASLWERWRTGYRYPDLVGAECTPQDHEFACSEEGEILEPEAFGPKGYLNDVLLNHRVVIKYNGIGTIRVPVPYLSQYFLIGRAEGLKEVARLLKIYQAKKLTPAAE